MTAHIPTGGEGARPEGVRPPRRSRWRASLRGLSAGNLELRQTWQVAAGAVLFPLGIVVIMLGWYGAAHASHVQQQIPYLVSGSFVGLGFMIVGALLYWAHWLYRIYDQADVHHRELLEALRPSGPSPSDSAVSHNGTVLATATGSTYHRPSCSVIERRRESARVVASSERTRLQPCQICQPELADGEPVPDR